MECICSVWRVGETPDPGAPRLPIAHSCWDHGAQAVSRSAKPPSEARETLTRPSTVVC